MIRNRHLEKNAQRQGEFSRTTKSQKEAVISKIYQSFAKNFVRTASCVLTELGNDDIEIPYKITQFR